MSSIDFNDNSILANSNETSVAPDSIFN
jgi:hypothetical protein